MDDTNQHQNGEAAKDANVTMESTTDAPTDGGETKTDGGAGGDTRDSGAMSKGNEDRKIFIGGVGYDTSNEDLQAHFSTFGEVAQAQVKYDRMTGRSRGFAFLEFANAESCKKALAAREQTIKGKQVEIKPAKSRENKKVFVGGLPSDFSEADLRTHFEQYGKVGACVQALAAREQTIKGKQVEIKPAKSRENKKVFVGGLPSDFSEADLRTHFEQYGKVGACVQALAAREQTIKGKQVEIKPAKSRENKKVFVGGLPSDFSEADLRTHFEQYGKVGACVQALAAREQTIKGKQVEIKPAKSRENKKVFVGGLPSDFSEADLRTHFEQYGKVGACVQALAAREQTIKGKQVEIKPAKSRENKKVFVGGLPSDFSEADLRTHFEQYGKVGACVQALAAREQTIKGKQVEIKPAKSRENKKVFVGGLPSDFSEADLRTHFEQYGKVGACVQALAAREQTIKGKQVEIKPAKSRENKKVFVGGLPSDFSEADLRTHFEQYGKVGACVQALAAREQTIKGKQVEIKPAKSRENKKVFVGGLPSDFSEADLRTHFEQYGKVGACVQALAAREQTIKGKQVEIKPAKSRENKKVFVGGLPSDFSEADLRTHFEQYGKVEDIEWPFDKQRNAKRNFAFIVFEEEDGADKASAVTKQTFADRECDVKKAVPQGRRGPTGMIGSARGGRGGRGGWGGMQGGGWGGYAGGGGWGDWYGQAAAAGGYPAAHGGYGGYADDYSSGGAYADYWGAGGAATAAGAGQGGAAAWNQYAASYDAAAAAYGGQAGGRRGGGGYQQHY